jgi:hypothetical protein
MNRIPLEPHFPSPPPVSPLESFGANEGVNEVDENSERHDAAQHIINQHGGSSQAIAGEDVQNAHKEHAESGSDENHIQVHGPAPGEAANTS